MLGVHDIRAEYVGPDEVHAGMRIDVDPGLSLEEANRIADEVRRRIHGETNTGYCVIRVDAAKPALPKETTDTGRLVART